MMKAGEIWGKTSGYKRGTGALLLALYQFVKAVSPDLLTGAADEVTRASIDILIITGGLDWVWTNRKKIVDFLTKKK